MLPHLHCFNNVFVVKTTKSFLLCSPVFSKRFSGQIALARKGGLGGYEGLYKCIIPDENGVDQTLVVGAYNNGGYNRNG